MVCIACSDSERHTGRCRGIHVCGRARNGSYLRQFMGPPVTASASRDAVSTMQWPELQQQRGCSRQQGAAVSGARRLLALLSLVTSLAKASWKRRQYCFSIVFIQFFVGMNAALTCSVVIFCINSIEYEACMWKVKVTCVFVCFLSAWYYMNQSVCIDSENVIR